MATTISLSIPDAQVTRVVNAMCAIGNYQSTLADGSANPQTKAQFAKQMLITYVMNTVKAVEAQAAVDNARTTAISNVDSQVVIT